MPFLSHAGIAVLCIAVSEHFRSVRHSSLSVLVTAFQGIAPAVRGHAHRRFSTATRFLSTPLRLTSCVLGAIPQHFRSVRFLSNPIRFQSVPCPWVLRHASPCSSHSGLRTSPPCFAAAVPVNASSFCAVHVHSDATLMYSVPCRFRSCLLRSTPSHFSATPRYAVSLPILAFLLLFVAPRIKSNLFASLPLHNNSVQGFSSSDLRHAQRSPFHSVSSPCLATLCRLSAYLINSVPYLFDSPPCFATPFHSLSLAVRSLPFHIVARPFLSAPCRFASTPFVSLPVPFTSLRFSANPCPSVSRHGNSFLYLSSSAQF